MKESKYHNIANAYPMLQNKGKYTGTLPLTLRSGWEIYFVFKWLDINPNVISWKSESTIIKYHSPVDNKSHRYFMDFTAICKTASGQEKEFWFEIKPYAQTQIPKIPKRKTDNYMYQVKTYLTNQAKWETTKRIVEEKKSQGQNIEFVLITEKDVPGFLKG